MEILVTFAKYFALCYCNKRLSYGVYLLIFFFKDDVLVICFGMNVTSLLFYKHLVFCVMPDEAIGGNGEDKTLLGLLDVSKGNCMAF